jgi:hypothetical protein
MTLKIETVSLVPTGNATGILNVSSEFIKRHMTVRNLCVAAMLATVTFSPQARIFLAVTFQLSATLAMVLGNLVILASNLMVSGLQAGGGLLSGLKSLLGSGKSAQKSEKTPEEKIAEQKVTVASSSWGDDFVKQETTSAQMVQDFVAQEIVVSNLVEDFVKEEQSAPAQIVQDFVAQEAVVSGKPKSMTDAFLAQAPRAPMQDLEQVWNEKVATATLSTVWDEVTSNTKVNREQGWAHIWQEAEKLQKTPFAKKCSKEDLRLAYEKELKGQFSKMEKIVTLGQNLKTAIIGRKIDFQQLSAQQKGLLQAMSVAEETMKAPAFSHLMYKARL